MIRHTFVILSFIAAAACGETGGHHHPDAAGSIDAAATTTIDETKVVGAANFVEGKFTALHGDRILVQLDATAPFDWNIHAHANGQTTTVVGARATMSARADFVPAMDGEYFLIVVNQGPQDLPVQVGMQIFGTTTWKWE